MGSSLIVSAARTPIGGFLGKLMRVGATTLGSIATREALSRARIDPSEVDEVYLGNVLSAGLGQAPARQAAIGAGIPDRVGATTINKVCGSGLKAILLADQALRLGEARVMLAGGMESMSQSPYLLERGRTGYRIGHGELIDSMIKDGLWDPYNGVHMGSCAERLAERYSLSREMQDQYAEESYRRAREAQSAGAFSEEIVPVTLPGEGNEILFEDEGPQRFDAAKMRMLPAVFEPKGTVTAANSSQISDGAAALVLTSEEEAKRRGLPPLARIVASAQTAGPPEWFTTAPIEAVRRLCARAGWVPRQVDLFEINEAFAGVVLVAARELGLDHRKVNIHGGAVALGHPIGASGARIVVTLIQALRRRGGRRGVAALCIGGGEAIALAVEIPD